MDYQATKTAQVMGIDEYGYRGSLNGREANTGDGRQETESITCGRWIAYVRLLTFFSGTMEAEDREGGLAFVKCLCTLLIRSQDVGVF